MDKFEAVLKEYETNIDSHVNKLIESIRNYYLNSKTNGFVIGMSGGLDCAVVGALCSLAKVPLIAITMPYQRHESLQRSKGIDHAKELCEKFDIPLYTVDISSVVNGVYDNGIDLPVSNLSKANVLPRIRMTQLYYMAQNTNRLVIGTGNLSEIVMGYFTKWGDGASDFNPVKGITKTQMYIIAKHIGVPESIINKAPSADLWDEQTDEKEMGITYYDLDRYILVNDVAEEIKTKIRNTTRRNKHKYTLNMFEGLDETIYKHIMG